MILLIEDETLTLKALEYRLKKEGYQVDIALDGREAIEKMQATPDAYRLVITDIMLPFKNGMEVIQYAKTALPKPVPVIVLSAVGAENTVLEAFKLGADDYITKPFSPAELSVRVKRLLI